MSKREKRRERDRDKTYFWHMGRSKKPEQKNSTVTSGGSGSGCSGGSGATSSTAPEEEKTHVFLYDGGQIKQTLDDSAIRTIADIGYEELNTYSNIKIIVGLLCCLLAVIAHFYPVPFPDNKIVLIICVVLYFTLNIFLQYVVTFHEKGCVTMVPTESDGKLATILVSSNLPRLEEMYTLTVSLKNSTKGETLKESITSFFDEEGTFEEEILSKKVRDLVKLVHQKKTE